MRSPTTRILFIGLLLLAASPAQAKKKKKPKSPPVTVVSNTQTTTTNNQQLTVTASCPPGLLAVGGGFAAPPSLTGTSLNGIYFVYESRRAGDSAWQASAVRGQSGPSLPLTTYADCRSAKLSTKKKGKKATAAKKRKKRKLAITEASASGSAEQFGQATATAICPPGTQVLGGGFSTAPNPTSSGVPLLEQTYRTAPGSWTSAIANSSMVTRSVTSYAYCAAGLSITETAGGATLPGSSGSSIGGATAVSPPCPKGRALLGGGFNNSIATTGGSSAVVLLDTSRPVGGTWQVSGLNDSGSQGTLESRGYCA